MKEHRFETFDWAVRESVGLLGNSIFLETWIPRDKFLYGVRLDTSLTLVREDKGKFGFGFGTNPKLPDSCSRFSIETKAHTSLSNSFEIKARWNAYVKTITPEIDLEDLPEMTPTDEEITNFLKTHAPDSSVMPGNSEIVQWATIASQGKLIGVAAICRWESGRYVVASVAIDKSQRGLGFGRSLMRRVDGVAYGLGIDQLCLGVMASNLSAIKLYEATGYRLLHEFSYIEPR